MALLYVSYDGRAYCTLVMMRGPKVSFRKFSRVGNWRNLDFKGGGRMMVGVCLNMCVCVQGFGFINDFEFWDS